MRIAALSATIMIALGACSTTSSPKTESLYVQPNQLMAGEIDRRIEQIPYLHGQELVDNLYWLVQAGEQSLPAVLASLKNESPKVRSSAAWVIGMIGDRRTIPEVQKAVDDPEAAVRFECARTLVLLGDVAQAPMLIEGLDSDHKGVRERCHEALKAGTGHDFGYDHLAANVDERRTSVLRWREWWGGYSGNARFALEYQQKFGLGMPAAPVGEGQNPQTPVKEQPVKIEQPVEVDQNATTEQPVKIEPPVTIEQPVKVEQPVTAEPPVTIEQPVKVEQPAPVGPSGGGN